MNPWGLSWTLSLEAALLVRTALGASLVLLGCYLACRLPGEAVWKKRLLQAAALLLCLLVLAEWLGVVEAVGQQGFGFFAARPPETRTAASPPAEPDRPVPVLPSGPAIQSPAVPPPQTTPETPLPSPVPRDLEPLPARTASAGGDSWVPHGEEQKKNASAWALPGAGFWLRMWMCGTGVLLLGQLAVAAYWHLRRRRWRHVEPQEPLWMQVQEAARELGLRRLPAVVVVPGSETPMLGGNWPPVLMLPEAFPRLWSPAQQRAVLAHELAHLLHRDPFWLALVRFATALLWWHPGMWLLQRRWRWWAELAADDAAARLPQAGFHLAEALLAAARQLVGSPSGPGWRGTVAFRSPLGNRIERLLQENISSGSTRQPPRWRTWICLGLGLVLALAPAAVISASDPFFTGEPAMRTAPWWRRSAVMLALLGLSAVPASAQDEPRSEPRPDAFQLLEPEREGPPRPHHPEADRPHQPHRVRHHGPPRDERPRLFSPQERLERLLRIAEELHRLGLREEAEHMRRRAEELKEELERRREEHRERFRRPGPPGDRPPFRPHAIRRPEFRPGPPSEVVEELMRVVRELREALHQTRRELEQSQRHFQRELEETRRHLERVTERLERLERLRDEDEDEKDEPDDDDR